MSESSAANAAYVAYAQLKLAHKLYQKQPDALAPDERLHLYRSDAELLAALDANRRAAEDNQNDSATR